MTRRRAVWGLGAVAAVLAACSDPGHDAAAQGTALRHLFRERERARHLVLWADASEPGPVFAATGTRAGRVDTRVAERLARVLGVPVTRVTAADMARLFREHPDAWAAFYARYAGAPGLVEVGPVERGPDAAHAAVAVGRSCGEHCRQAWRVTLRAGGAGRWRPVAVTPLRVP